MEPPFEFAHLSPACDPPERYQAAAELLAELWGRVRAFRADCNDDPFLTAVTGHLEAQLVAAGLVLGIQLDLICRR
ncbi:hypothetical protein ABIB90_007541 [Bradyrhizobium sp. JR4.1]|uniref:hypothetical protein n=1 Tax=unclassified Bradyrhizobium TaxID=2631580 RepID=UPI0033932226